MPTGDAMDARRPARYRRSVVARPPRLHLAEDDEYAWLAHPQRVLLAEDDERMRRLVANALRDDGFDVIEARNGAEPRVGRLPPPAPARWSPGRPDLVGDARPGKKGEKR
jgi:hypothetical protein